MSSLTTHKGFSMLHTIGCLVLAAIASVVAVPICAFCLSAGYTGIAALAGAGVVLSMIPGS